MPLLGPSLAPPDARKDRAELPDLFPEPPVDRWGRYKLQGRHYTRATTIAHTLDDGYQLHRWQETQVILGLIKRPALWATANSLHPDDKKALKQLAEDAKEAAGANDRARIGTARHRLFEYLDTGRMTLDQVMDPEAKADAEAYYGCLAAAGLTPMAGWVETVVVVDHLGVAGTVDRVVQTADGKLRVLDLKTSADMRWSYDSWAMQIGLYSQATHIWNRATDTLIDIIPSFDQDAACILWVPAGEGRAELHDVKLRGLPSDGDTEITSARYAIDLAVEVRKLSGFGKKVTSLVASYNPQTDLDFQAETLRQRCRAMIDHCPAVETPLYDRWPAGVPSWAEALERGHKYTRAELDTIESIVAEGEAALGMPFNVPRDFEHLRAEPANEQVEPECEGEADNPFEGLPTGDGEDPVRAAATEARTGFIAEVFGPVPAYEPPKPRLEVVRHPDDAYPQPPADDETVAAIKAAFPGAEVVSRRRIITPDVQAIMDRQAALPADLRGQITTWYQASGMPNLQYGQHTPEQLDAANQRISQAEADLETRVRRLNLEVGAALPSVAGYVLTGPYTGAEQLTKDEAEAIVALYEAHANGWVEAYTGDDGNVRLRTPEDQRKTIEAAIKRRHGGAQAAKLAAARWALGLARPRTERYPTIKSMAENPIMAAVMALGPTTNTPDTKAGADDDAVN